MDGEQFSEPSEGTVQGSTDVGRHERYGLQEVPTSNAGPTPLCTLPHRVMLPPSRTGAALTCSTTVPLIHCSRAAVSAMLSS